MEKLNDENGRPSVKFINFKVEGLKEIDISISHCKQYAVATVVAEIDKGEVRNGIF